MINKIKNIFAKDKTRNNPPRNKSEEEENELWNEEEEINPTSETEELLARTGELESKIPRLEMTITSLKKENDELRDSIHKINENFQDVMSLYEVVSNQVNPFIGTSKITSNTIENIEKLENETEYLKTKVEGLHNDIVCLADLYLKQYDVDLDEIIEDILIDEEVSKIISGDDLNG